MSASEPPGPPRSKWVPLNYSPSPSLEEAAAAALLAGEPTVTQPTARARGSIFPKSWHAISFPVFLPVFITLVTLNVATMRDIISLHQRMRKIDAENAPALETLKKSGGQTEFLQKLQTGLQKLSPTDPIAAQIKADFFGDPPLPQPPGATPAN